MGGHSCGRSLRSVLLEGIQVKLREKDLNTAKLYLGILLAMYHDYRYINRHHWFDYKLEGMRDLPLFDRIPLCAAAFALGVDELPNLSDWPNQKILSLVRS